MAATFAWRKGTRLYSSHLPTLFNIILVGVLLLRRTAQRTVGPSRTLASVACPQEEQRDATGLTCPGSCGAGECVKGACVCRVSWEGPDCSQRTCPRNCSGRGICTQPGFTCLCPRSYAGDDCSERVADLLQPELLQLLGPPFTQSPNANSSEIMVTAKGVRRYGTTLCRTKPCSSQWASLAAYLEAFLPKDDYHPRFKTCAVVNSARQLVSMDEEEEEEEEEEQEQDEDGEQTEANGEEKPLGDRDRGWGAEIDSHAMVMRLDNAPTEGYEKWVGSRTTHRLVQADYARMVHSMLGTEVVVAQTKSVVTPSTWWAGGYPSVEKVTYILAVSPERLGKRELRLGERADYTPFTEVFPGNKRLLVSPVFMRDVEEMQGRTMEGLRSLGLDCYKRPPKLGVPPVLLATSLSLQMCDVVDVYGVTLNTMGERHRQSGRRSRDGAKIVWGHGGAGLSDASEKCCYYPSEDGYSPSGPLCDDLTKRHILRVLSETDRVRVFD